MWVMASGTKSLALGTKSLLDLGTKSLALGIKSFALALGPQVLVNITATRCNIQAKNTALPRPPS